MSLIEKVFGNSPFGPMLEHARKIHECVKLIRPIMEALIEEDYEKVHQLQDQVSKLEYEADRIEQGIRERLPRRYFLPVSRADVDEYLHLQDGIADAAEDFAVLLIIRHTRIHPDLSDEFFNFVDQVVSVSNKFLAAAEEIQNLAETSFGGAEARHVLEQIEDLGEEEWKADRMQRKLSMHIYDKESELDPITIFFYERILSALSEVANTTENTGDMLRRMIVKGR